MRISRVWPIFILCSVAATVNAQQNPALSKDAPPPPQMQKLEEGQAPAVTITPNEKKNQVTEKRAPGGKVTEVDVKSGKSLYTLKPNDQQVGTSQPGDAESSSTHGGTQWKVMSFGPNRSQQEPQDSAAPNALPPATMPAATEKK